MIYGNPVRGTIHPVTWQRPAGSLDFVVTQVFGCTGFEREPPLGSCLHFHRGLDLGNAHCGADVIAAAAGTIHFAGTFANGEHAVTIDHGSGDATVYGHLATIAVAKGAKIAQGGEIGTVGASGNATACHLHFAVKSGVNLSLNVLSDANGRWLDPWSRLAQNVTIHPTGADINIRAAAGSGSTFGAIFARTKDDGNIYRASDNVKLGVTAAQRPWGGSVNGASYAVNGIGGSTWEKMYLGGAWRYVATPLTVKSAS